MSTNKYFRLVNYLNFPCLEMVLTMPDTLYLKIGDNIYDEHYNEDFFILSIKKNIVVCRLIYIFNANLQDFSSKFIGKFDIVLS